MYRRVSIHAPARGATDFYSANDFKRDVSIHAPARGATQGRFCLSRRRNTFQFTRPRGARPHEREYNRRHRDGFQFTRPRGARLLRFAPMNGPRTFQFTRPRGARQRSDGRSVCQYGFNSRAREGRDAQTKRFSGFAGGFNSRAREGRDGCNAGRRI